MGKLKSKVGQSVVLFGVDGMSYFGELTEIQRNNVAVLKPSPLSDSSLVEIQNPAEISAVENWSKVEISSLAGFGFDITGDPFVMPDDDAEDIGIEPEGAALPEETARAGCACPSPESPVVTISALGGFLFAGTLDNSGRGTAELSIEYIFAPGGDGSTLFQINKAIVNLNASTSVSG
jgi:hypothetical protein